MSLLSRVHLLVCLIVLVFACLIELAFACTIELDSTRTHERKLALNLCTIYSTYVHCIGLLSMLVATYAHSMFVVVHDSKVTITAPW